MTRLGYDFRPVTDEQTELDQLVSLLGVVWPGSQHLTSNYLRWQYFQNPMGRVVGVNAWRGKELVAHYAAIPLEAEVNGDIRRGLLSLNTAVHPLHQGKGLFVTLAEKTYAIARSGQFEFVVGVANANSAHGFTRRLGFAHLGQLDARVSASLPRLLENTVAPTSEWTTVWSQASYAWRLANPSRTYSYRLSEDGQVCYVFGDVKRLGMRPLARMEFNKSLIITIRGSISPLKRRFPFYSFGRYSRRYKFGSFSLSIPKRVYSSPLHLIFLNLNPDDAPLDTRITIDPLDFDLV